MIYLNKEHSYLYKINSKKGIISNKFTGNYKYIPIECFKALEYASENNIELHELTKVFEDEEDQQYYLKLLEMLKKLGLVSNKKEKQLEISCINKIDISLTNRCNLNCGYCCVESENSSKFKELNFEEVKTMIDVVLKNLKPTFINLSGGEIFLRKDIYDIISYIRSKFDGHLKISTNGILIKEERLDFLVKNIDSIDISLDGYDEETVSKERGKGTFTKVINLINNLKDKNFNKIQLSLVESKKTELYIEKFKQLADELEIKSIIRSFNSFGRGKKNSAYVHDDRDIEYFTKNIDNSYLQLDYVSVCRAGINSIFVNYDGNVFLCPNLQDEKFKICDISEIDDCFLEKISNKEFKAYENLEKIKTKSFDHCNDCEYKLFCCTCPASMAMIYDNKELLKHNCKKFKEQLGINLRTI
ncbi:radical SAM/SPASM domain-containing protein [Paraclostridium sordellii]|uniref:radical SAM/SPASM domain-containing protein n=1 Tax=Paraclostridium sordellii TaxID=1505 RepID=UPI0005DEAC3B|nr:radical SAM protein [Paeniclostridium sordellii]CEN23593.1 radical SAM domain-containing protein [[Clostridium] sordellii] [Paeniclostridium sordellii]